EDRVLAIPQGQGEAESLLVIGNTSQAVLAPAIGAGPRLVVAEVIPGIAAFAVVFADGPPLPLAEVRSPLLPGPTRLSRFIQPPVFCCHGESLLGFSDPAYSSGCEQFNVRENKTAWNDFALPASFVAAGTVGTDLHPISVSWSKGTLASTIP